MGYALRRSVSCLRVEFARGIVMDSNEIEGIFVLSTLQWYFRLDVLPQQQ